MLCTESLLTRDLVVYIYQYLVQRIRLQVESMQGSGSLHEDDIVAICERAIEESGVEYAMAVCCKEWMSHALSKGVDIARCELDQQRER